MNQEFDEYNTHSLFFGSHMKSCSLLFSKHIEISNTPKVKEDKIINHSIHKLNTNAARVKDNTIINHAIHLNTNFR